MRKVWVSIISILVIIAAIIIFVPLGLSFYLAKNANTLIKNLYISPKVSLTLLNFNRGWFTSTARLKVNIDLSPSLGKSKSAVTYSFISNLKILNGPFIFYRTNEDKLKFAFAKGVLVNRINNPDLQFRNVSIWYFTNKILSHYHTQKFDHDFKPMNTKLALVNASGDSIYNLKTGDLTATTTIQDGNLNMLHDEGSPHEMNIKIQGLQSSIKTNVNMSPWYMFGIGNFSIQQLGISSSLSSPITMNNLSLRIKSLKQNETVANDIYLNADKIMRGANELGTLSLVLNISGLNAKAYLAIHDQVMKMENNDTLNDPEEMHRLNILLLNLLSRGFNIELQKLYFGTAQGAVNLSGTLKVPNLNGQMNPIALLFESKAKLDLQIPRVWLSNLLAEFYKTMFAELNKQQGNMEEGQMNNAAALTNNVINHWVDNKMLIVNGDNLIMKLELQSGRLLINGLSPKFSAHDLAPPSEPPMKPLPVPPVNPIPPVKPAPPVPQGKQISHG